MRILADENVPGRVVRELRELGHDVRWVREDSPGLGDRAVLELACSEARLLLTFDKDFGELVFRLGRDASRGVILCRLPPGPPEAVAGFVARVFELVGDRTGCFVVAEPTRVRIRALNSGIGPRGGG